MTQTNHHTSSSSKGWRGGWTILAIVFLIIFFGTPRGKKFLGDSTGGLVPVDEERYRAIVESFRNEDFLANKAGYQETREKSFINSEGQVVRYKMKKTAAGGDPFIEFIMPESGQEIRANITRAGIEIVDGLESLTKKETWDKIKQWLDELYKRLQGISSAVFYFPRFCFGCIISHMENTNNNPIVITREFAAPVEKLWAAWSVPEEMMKWWGPEGFSCPTAQIDFQMGGKYLLCMHGNDNGPKEFAGLDMWSTGTYKEIHPMKRIVVTDSFADKDGNIISAETFGMHGFPLSVDVEIDFASEGDKSTMTITHHDIPEAERSNCMQGWNSSLDKLARSVQ